MKTPIAKIRQQLTELWLERNRLLKELHTLRLNSIGDYKYSKVITVKPLETYNEPTQYIVYANKPITTDSELSEFEGDNLFETEEDGVLMVINSDDVKLM